MTNAGHWRRPRLVRAIAAFALALHIGAGAQEALVRPEVSVAAQAAQSALTERDAARATAAIAKAEALQALTPAERYFIEQTRASVALAVGDRAAQARVLTATLGTGAVPTAQRLPLLEALLEAQYAGKDHQGAAATAILYLEAGGTRAGTLQMGAHSTLLTGAPASAVRMLTMATNGPEPARESLELLAQAHRRLKQPEQYEATLERLISLYPRPGYWIDLLASVDERVTWSRELELDWMRLQFSSGVLQDAADFAALAEALLRQGYPVEAQKVLDVQATRPGANTAGPMGALRARVRAQAEEDRGLRSGSDRARLAALEPGALFRTGYALALNGDTAGFEWMEADLRRMTGDKSTPTLRFAVALARAGDANRARELLAPLTSGEGAGLLARLWRVHLGSVAAH